jgi:phosphoesterase RecJ-like protein
MYPQAEAIKSIIDGAQRIVVLQADNPDGDSLGSALALEQIVSALGKEVSLYCSVDMPAYLHYLAGYDRVSSELPDQFDASLIVDASTMTLFSNLQDAGLYHRLGESPCIVLDHHATTDHPIEYASVTLNDPMRSSASEVVYALACQLKWPLPLTAQTSVMTGILGDTQGLSNDLTKPTTYDVMGELVRAGVNRPALEEARRQFGKMPLESLRYKGRLIERAEFFYDNSIVIVSIPNEEIITLSPLYNPAALIHFDLLQTEQVRMAVVLKHYADGKTTGAIRCNPGSGVGGSLAAQFGGGGHDFASGFKMTDEHNFTDLKHDLVKQAAVLLKQLDE